MREAIGNSQPIVARSRPGWSWGVRPMSRGSQTYLVALAACLTPIVLAPALGGAFVFDDIPNLVDNPAFNQPIEGLRGLWQAALSSDATAAGRPLAMLTFAVNFMLTGLDPFWFKLANLVLHLTNGILLWRLLCDLLVASPMAPALQAANVDPRRAAAWLAIVWCSLAIQISAIFLVVQRMELLAHSFVLLGLICYLAGRRRMMRREPGAAFLVFAGLAILPALGALAKESAVMTPAYALLMEVFLLRFRAANPAHGRRLQLAHVGICVAGLLVFLGWVLPASLDPGSWSRRDFDLGERLWSEARALWLYLRWILIPDLASMSLYHDAFRVSRGWTEPASTWVAAVAWIAVLTWLAIRTRRPSLSAFGVAFYLAAHLPTATVVPLELVFEHRNYTASIGVLLAALALILRLSAASGRVRAALPWLLASYLIAQWGAAGLRSLEWSDPLRHATAEAARNPDSPRAVYELGRIQYLASRGAPSHPAFAAAVASFERAAALPGASALPLQALLQAGSRAGLADAELWDRLDEYLRRPRLDAQSVNALIGLVSCVGRGECRLSNARLVQALTIAANRDSPAPELLEAYATFAMTHLKDMTLAGELFGAAVQAEPGNPMRHHALAQYLAITGRFEDAERELAEMRRRDRLGRYRSSADKLAGFIAELRARDQRS